MAQSMYYLIKKSMDWGIHAFYLSRKDGLSHFGVFDFVLIGVFQVFTTHTPDEHVVAGTGSGVDAPFG